MELFDKMRPAELERRELQLTIFASSAIAILGIGTALLMYPLVFSGQNAGNTMLHVGFFGFCGLSLLLSIYLWDRQRTVQRLRREVAADRMRIAEAQAQASGELLRTMPNMSAFQDRLPMEYRRTAATSQKLSILMVMLRLPAGTSQSASTVLLSDAAKAVSRRLRDQDCLYMLSPVFFAAVLPGVDLRSAEGYSSRISGGPCRCRRRRQSRFTFELKDHRIIPTTPQAPMNWSAPSVPLMPADNSMHEMAQAIG